VQREDKEINLKLTILFLLPVVFMLLAACGGISESDIEATVEARVTEKRDIDATVKARAKAIAKAMVVKNSFDLRAATTTRQSRPYPTSFDIALNLTGN
jgi:hypothetical protein